MVSPVCTTELMSSSLSVITTWKIEMVCVVFCFVYLIIRFNAIPELKV